MLVTRAVTSCLLDTTQRAEPHAIVQTPRGPVWMLEMYRPDARGRRDCSARPADEDPEPILIREIGRCVGEPAARLCHRAACRMCRCRRQELQEHSEHWTTGHGLEAQAKCGFYGGRGGFGACGDGERRL